MTVEDPRGNPEISGGEQDTTQPGPPGSTGGPYRAPGPPVAEPTAGEADTTYPGGGTQAPGYSSGQGFTTPTPPTSYQATASGQTQDTSQLGSGIGAGVGTGVVPATMAAPTAVAAPRGAVVTFVPITNLATPTGLTATPATTGGTLAAGTYGYRVVAKNASGYSAACAEVTATTTGATGSVALAWTAVAGATTYDVYGRTPRGETLLKANVGTNSYTDTAVDAPGVQVPPTAAAQGTSEVQNYLVRATPADNTQQTVSQTVQATAVPNNQATFANLNPGGAYTFTVAAQSLAGTGAYSPASGSVTAGAGTGTNPAFGAPGTQ